MIVLKTIFLCILAVAIWNFLMWLLTGETMFKMFKKYFTRYKVVEVSSGVYISFFLLFSNNDIQFPNVTGTFGWYPLHKCSDTKIQLNNRELGGRTMAQVDSLIKAANVIQMSKDCRKELINNSKKFKRKTIYL